MLHRCWWVGRAQQGDGGLSLLERGNEQWGRGRAKRHSTTSAPRLAPIQPNPPPDPSTQMAQTSTHISNDSAAVAASLLLTVAAAARRLPAGGWGQGAPSRRVSRSQAAVTVQRGKGQARRQSPTASTQMHRHERERFEDRAATAGGAAIRASPHNLTRTSSFPSSCCGWRCAPARCRWVEDRRVSHQPAGRG